MSSPAGKRLRLLASVLSVLGLAVLIAYHQKPVDLSSSAAIVVLVQLALILPFCYRCAAAALRRMLFRRGWIPVTRMRAPVIVVGNINVGGNTVNIGPQSAVVRGVGLLSSIEDLRNTMLTQNAGVPVLVRDIAKVQISYKPRLGIAGRDADAVRERDG